MTVPAGSAPRPRSSTPSGVDAVETAGVGVDAGVTEVDVVVGVAGVVVVVVFFVINMSSNAGERTSIPASNADRARCRSEDVEEESWVAVVLVVEVGVGGREV